MAQETEQTDFKDKSGKRKLD